MMISIRFFNVGLRSLTLGVRFLFIFFLARYLTPETVGYYGLFTATVGYCLYFVGLDFYTYLTREILKSPQDRRGGLLKAQAGLSVSLFLTLIPVVLIALPYAGWPPALLWWFLPILLFEYLNQEIYRLLIALSRQIPASILLFMRQGSWAIATLLVMGMMPEARNLHVLMAFWGISGLITAMLGILLVHRLRLGGWRDAIDWRWLWRGISVSAAFLMATLALRGMQTLDRYWLESLGGIESVAAYVLFLGVASTLLTFLDAGVFAFGYPELINQHNTGDADATRITLRKMLIQTLIISAGFGIASWLALPYLLDWIGNPVYEDRREIFPLLILAMIINAIGMIPHYALYASRRDRPIIHSHLASLAAFVLTTWLLVLTLPQGKLELAIPLALNAGFLLILLWKTLALFFLRGADPASQSSQPTVANLK
jgi:O-antigen/teichoic acid export membrane protein